ncbi:MAG: hypothetical protein EOP62_00890 [Sphingomonadales bacterium]|nr:MAG: hypothetical protein EOP62_00890 [Sphingomonadales bacterium]
MASETLLLVLIIKEAGLRSTLAARLSLAGADMLTADDFEDPRLARHKKRPLVLISDEAAVMEHEGGCDGLVADPRWLRVVILSPGACEGSDNPRLIRLERKSAAKAIGALLPEWQATPA